MTNTFPRRRLEVKLMPRASGARWQARAAQVSGEFERVRALLRLVVPWVHFGIDGAPSARHQR